MAHLSPLRPTEEMRMQTCTIIKVLYFNFERTSISNVTIGIHLFSLRMKYIETELKKKKGLVEAVEQKVIVKTAEDLLYELPENIRVNSAKKTEEMLSNQMLSGIPEVDLGIEYGDTSLKTKLDLLAKLPATVLH